MSGNASKGCISRLQKEYKAFLKEPPPGIKAHPNSQNILEWHYAIEGHKGSAFEGGIYHGQSHEHCLFWRPSGDPLNACFQENTILARQFYGPIVPMLFEATKETRKVLFHPQYPFKAPGIMMLTPNGRFKTGSRLCLSMSDFHPESWNPLWSIGTILTGLMSFMYENEMTTGALNTPSSERRRLAQQSLEFNLKNPTFRDMFPEYIQENERRQQLKAQKPEEKTLKASESSPPANKSSISNFLVMTTFALAIGSIILIPLLT